MALKWVLNSAYNIVLGQSAEASTECNPKITFPDGRVDQKNIKQSLGSSNAREKCITGFQMPLHYPRYQKDDYEKMEEWKVDMLLKEYGINFKGSLDEKRKFAMGTFLWPDQY